MKAAVDNDILYKGACYGLLRELFGVIPADTSEIGILGAARFVVRAKLRKAKLTKNCDSAIQLFEDVIHPVVILEPTTEERKYAAELEYAAQVSNHSLDEGESQLCAIVILRAWSWLVTGDKRAISALEPVLSARKEAARLAGRVLCLEQLFLKLVSTNRAAAIRKAVCSEPDVDRAMAVCFSCSTIEGGMESWAEGLLSYIANLRKSAPVILAA